MRNPFHTPFAAVFTNEVLLNSKRVAPYVLMLLFIVNAVMWSVRGAAATRGWATNSDFNIARNFLGFSWVLGLPIFNAVIMGGPVLRDFRLGVDSLIFSKPISRASYLIGKFLGNFFVFVCCMSIYALALIVFQVIHTSQMIVLPVRVLPYFKHFFFFTVISHLFLAAIYFSVATLTRSTKLMYGLAVSFFPVYLGILFVVNSLPARWRQILDPLLFSSVDLKIVAGTTKPAPAFIDQYVVSYGPEFFINRGLVILGAIVCLTILYLRFTVAERSERAEEFSVLELSTAADRVYYSAASLPDKRVVRVDKPESNERVMLPSVATASHGFRTTVDKLIAALGIEFQLLRAERSLVVLVPLILFFSIFDLAFYKVAPEISYSVTYATGTANALLLFLLGITVFYTGEAMHRDRELKIVPVLWSAPIPNSVLLLSKYFSTIVLTFSFIVTVGLLALMVQLLRGHTPIDLSAYFITYSVVLVPGIIFVTALVIFLNVLLRNKYAAYVVAIGIGAGLLYLYSIGHNHWRYNPFLYRLWKYGDLTSGTTLAHRLYWLALAVVCLALAHVLFERKS